MRLYRRASHIIGSLSALLIFLIVGKFSEQIITETSEFPERGKIDQKRIMHTALGMVSYEELLKKVYRPLGFVIVDFDDILLKLRSIQPWKCNKTFSVKFWVRPHGDQKEIPMRTKSNYTLNGYVELKRRVSDNQSNTSTNRADSVSEKSTTNKTGLLSASYSQLVCATTYDSVRNQTGLIFEPFENRIRNRKAWIETICLNNGAAQLTSIRPSYAYNTNPNVHFISSKAFSESWKKYHKQFDFVVMFSVIEYLGFGRYGDSIDPFADVREMRKAHCSLKMGGLLFLAIPVGIDSIDYPIRRCYGRLRLPFIIQGFRVLHYFEGYDALPKSLSMDLFESSEQYVLFVLKKS